MNKKGITLTVLLILVTLIYLFWGLTPKNYSFFLGRRIPKVLVMYVLALGIGTSTLVFQTITMNRILTPSILGMDAIFLVFNVSLAFLSKNLIKLISNPYLYFLVSSSFTIIITFIIFKSIFDKEHINIQKIVLIGIVIGTMLRSVATLLQMAMDPNEFNIVNDLGYASINNANTTLIYFVIPLLLFIIFCFLKANKKLDIMLLGREQSINLGLNYEKLSRRYLLLIAVLISITTSLVGPITFFGIVIVNIAREISASFKHKDLIILTMLIGSFILIFSQLLLERILKFSMPVGILISFFGGFYFLYILIKESKNV